MFKKLLCLMTALAGMSFSMEQQIGEEDGCPMVHSYNCRNQSVEFRKTFHSLAGEPIIVSIQYLSSAGVGNEEIALKPQWTVFQSWVADEPIGIYANCKVRVDNGRLRQFNERVYFHQVWDEELQQEVLGVSPDTMHLGFTKDSPSRLIEYNVKYSDGFGSEFAESKNGTTQHGFILLLDDDDKNKCYISPDLTEEGLFVLIDQTSLAERANVIKAALGLIEPGAQSNIADPSGDFFSELAEFMDSEIEHLKLIDSAACSNSPSPATPKSSFDELKEAIDDCLETVSKTIRCKSSISKSKVKKRIFHVKLIAEKLKINTNKIDITSFMLDDDTRGNNATYLNELSQELFNLRCDIQRRANETQCENDSAIRDESEIGEAPCRFDAFDESTAGSCEMGDAPYKVAPLELAPGACEIAEAPYLELAPEACEVGGAPCRVTPLELETETCEVDEAPYRIADTEPTAAPEEIDERLEEPNFDQRSWRSYFNQMQRMLNKHTK